VLRAIVDAPPVAPDQAPALADALRAHFPALPIAPPRTDVAVIVDSTPPVLVLRLAHLPFLAGTGALPPAMLKGLLAALGALFIGALVMHELARLRQRFIVLGCPDEQPQQGGCLVPANDNAAKLSKLYGLWERRNGLKHFACFAVSFAYIYVTGVLLEAWDCIPTPDGLKLRSDPNTLCTSRKHHRFRLIAMILIVVIGPGVPVGYALWLRHLRGHALSTAASSSARSDTVRSTASGRSKSAQTCATAAPSISTAMAAGKAWHNAWLSALVETKRSPLTIKPRCTRGELN
jgi:hypothetical protein